MKKTVLVVAISAALATLVVGQIGDEPTTRLTQTRLSSVELANTKPSSPTSLPISTGKPDLEQTQLCRLLQQQMQDLPSLLATLKEQLLIDEEAALLAWATADASTLGEQDYEVLLFFADYLAEQYSPLVAIERFELVAQYKPEDYREVAVELIDNHADAVAAHDLLAFINTEKYQSIADIVAPTVGKSLYQQGADTAIAMLGQIAEADMREAAEESFFREWYSNDADTLAMYLDQQPNDPAFNDIYADMASRALAGGAQESLAWAERIEDPELQQEQVIRAAYNWQAYGDTESYREWRSQITDPALTAKLDEQADAMAYRQRFLAEFRVAKDAFDIALEDGALNKSHITGLEAAVMTTQQRYYSDVATQPEAERHWQYVISRINTRQMKSILQYSGSSLLGLIDPTS